MAIKKSFVSAFIVIVGLYTFSSYAFKKSDDVIKLEIYPGQKVIFLGKNTGLKEFGRVLNDWEKIHDAIYAFRQRDCIRDKLTIDSIETFDMLASQQSTDLKGKLFTLGTSDPCGKDKTSSGPSWKISESDGAYTVVSYSMIEE